MIRLATHETRHMVVSVRNGFSGVLLSLKFQNIEIISKYKYTNKKSNNCNRKKLLRFRKVKHKKKSRTPKSITKFLFF